MRRWLLLMAMLFAPGCASADIDGRPRVPFPLREAFAGAKWGAWTPEFPPE